MYKRNVEKNISRLLTSFRAIALTGARQVGKSFFLKKYCNDNDGLYFSLDDPLTRDEVRQDSYGWLKKNRIKGKIFIIDEAVKCPEIFSAIKIVVDEEDPIPTQIIIASSANYLMIKNIKESLAGRVALINLYPLSWMEFYGKEKSNISLLINPKKFLEVQTKLELKNIKRDRELFLLTGGFPEVRTNNNWDFSHHWANNYYSTYILPLALELFNITKQYSMEKTFQYIALNTAQLLNYSDIAVFTGASSPTIKSYIHYYQAMMVCLEIHQFFPNHIKRLVKSPKIHILDPIFSNLSYGFHRNLAMLQNINKVGFIYESFILSELMKINEYESRFFRFSTWRTEDGAEVDIVLENGLHKIPIEIKYKENITRRDLSGLRSWFKAYDKEAPYGFIIYSGNVPIQLDAKIWAIPDFLLFGI